MCGIAGLVNYRDGASLVRAMAQRIAHRGPDGAGVHEHQGSQQVQLAHQRLAIIDLRPESDQPFVKDGLVLVYNGELYNYRALRQILQDGGVNFRTDSDTEVILESWRRWGPDCLNRFRGMFAFALLEQDSGTVYLARDQLGIKPLYVHAAGSKVAFASEQKAVLEAMGQVRINEDGIVASMLYYWVPDDVPTIQGIEKLPPGHWAVKRAGQPLERIRYWSITEDIDRNNTPDIQQLREVITDSVGAHLVADVPVSTFLSGGLDSSLITAIAKQHNAAIDAYTIGFRPEDTALESMPDDLSYARKVADRFGVKLHEIVIEPDIVKMLDVVVDALDEPIGDPAAINTVLICQAARAAGVKVLLSGMGADELFGGYRKHYACQLAAQYRRLPNWLRESLIASTVRHLPVSFGGRGLKTVRWAKRFLSFANLSEADAFRRSYTLYDEPELESLLSPQFSPHVANVVAHHDRIYASTGFDEPVNRMCMTDAQLFMVGLNLTYTDRASMHASTEVRVPFVDIEVAKAAFALPGSAKIHRGESKHILKQAAEDILPKEIIYRPKAAFSAPLRAWIQRDLAELIDDELLNGEMVRSGMLNGPQLHKMVQSDRTGMEDRSKEIWQLLTLERWMQNLKRGA